MTTQRKWPKISKTFTANGSNTGLVRVDSVAGFYLFQKVFVKSDLVSELKNLQIIEILSDKSIRIGQFSEENKRIITDLSAFLAADKARVIAPEQKMSLVDYQTIVQEVFERFPVDAIRMLPVDKDGNSHTLDNPFATIDLSTTAPARKNAQLNNLVNLGKDLSTLDLLINDDCQFITLNDGTLIKTS